MENKIKKILSIAFIGIFLFSVSASAISITNPDSNKTQLILRNINQPLIKTKNDYKTDIEPFGDLEITFTIKEIRAFDKIDSISDPDFYVKLTINGEEFESDIWHNQRIIREEWTKTVNIPDDQENISIEIQLWDWNPGIDKLCDISSDNYNYVNSDNIAGIVYNTKTGHWRGSDQNYPDTTPSDVSGYGRLNGCDDNTYDRNDRDCQILFDITQTDPDGDGIPSWTEENIYGTDPEFDNTGWDNDSDGVPIEWEYEFGHVFYEWHGWKCYWIWNPFEYEDHKNMDPDRDGLDNVEEYLTSAWGSDPFHQDIFLELDQMEISEDKGNYVPQEAKEKLIDAYGKHNIALHIDDHDEDEMTGGELIPFKEEVNAWKEARVLRENYFLHNDPNNWRRGVFHYGLIVYRSTSAAGFAFDGDSFLMTTSYANRQSDFKLRTIINTKILNTEERRSQVYASIMMHESGHVLGIHYGNTKGCDNRDTYYPWQLGWWIWGNYVSCMNYRYVNEIVDYSDGSHGKNDFDDWARIDLTRFQN